MNLRPYQRDAVSGVDSALKGKRSALVVMPTGTGKTVCFAHIARNAVKRVMVIAHREELVQQAVSKIRSVTGLSPDVEMAEYKAGRLYKSPVVVASVQTLCAPFHNVYRMDKFDPHEFDMLVIDEALMRRLRHTVALLITSLRTQICALLVLLQRLTALTSLRLVLCLNLLLSTTKSCKRCMTDG